MRPGQRCPPLRDRISRRHLDEQRRLHAKPEGYGGKGDRHRDAVRILLKETGARHAVDYGCGQGKLFGKGFIREIDPAWELFRYDPAVEIFNEDPPRCDLVVCTDVMEHVEAARVDAVVDHLADLTIEALYLVIALQETSKRLSDGSSAHCTLRSPEWWRETFARRFQPYAEDGAAVRMVRALASGTEKHFIALLQPRS